MALANVLAFLSASNTCVRPQEDVLFDCFVQNTTANPLTLTNVEVNVSPAGCAVYRSYPLLPPFQTVIAPNAGFHYAFSQRFYAVGDNSGNSFKAFVSCTFYDSAGDVAVSGVCQVSIYPLLPTLFVQALLPANSSPASIGGSQPTQPPPVPSGIGMPVLPVLGQLWSEDERNSGVVAIAVGGV